MPLTEPQFESIIRYLDDELSQEEEILFVKQLSENKELQEAFDIELILRQQQQEHEITSQSEDLRFEPADKFLARAESTISSPPKQKEEQTATTPVIRLLNRKNIAAIAAAVVVLVVASFLYYSLQNKEKKIAENKGTQTGNKSVAHLKDTILNPNDTGYLSNGKNDLAEIAANYYNRYRQNTDDPAEISLYYQFYSQKKYTDVLKATETDYETKGGSSNSEQKLLKQYMSFYKALSYIETAEFAKGASLLNAIIKSNKNRDNLYYSSQYYLLMDYMKMNDTKNTQELLTAILNDENNPNRKTAQKINKLIERK